MQHSTPRLRMIVIVALVALAALAALPTSPARATSAFADPAFERQWQAGEAVTPNFWGPLGTTRVGQQEAYDGVMRVVQYFDKGRMELTNGSVTNGLLATELLSGRLQTGTTTFENHSPPDAVMAGDQDPRYPGGGVPAPTYAVVSKVKDLTKPTDTKVGFASTTSLQTFGGSPISPTIYATGSYPHGADFADAAVARFDDVTRHNVPAAFAAYRDRAGLSTIGYAIIEPFWSPVKVGGVAKQVLIQAFERRVLTYTPDNPAEYQVEMGNVGQHYYWWRYGGSVAAAPAVPSTPAASSAAAFPIGQVFIDASRSTNGARYAMEIGATTGAATTNRVTILPFEHGTMLYLASRNTFFVLLEQTGSPTGSALTVLPRTFGDGGLTTALVPGPRPGTFVPRLGFGRIWQDNPTVQQQLGYATGDEMSFTATVQAFERGLLISSPGANVVYELDTTMMRWYLLPLA